MCEKCNLGMFQGGNCAPRAPAPRIAPLRPMVGQALRASRRSWWGEHSVRAGAHGGASTPCEPARKTRELRGSLGELAPPEAVNVAVHGEIAARSESSPYQRQSTLPDMAKLLRGSLGELAPGDG